MNLNKERVQISENTKISELVKHNEASIDAIASINKHFLKLKNPVLRKLLAKRVTIKDAAKIGLASVDEFYRVLTDIGFEVVVDEFERSNKKQKANRKEEKVMDISKIDKLTITELDVREELSGGSDPFNTIMDALKSMPEGNTLKVINVFEPIPLINILSKKGFNSHVDNSQDGMVITYFKKLSIEDLDIETQYADKDTFEKVKAFYGDKIVEIDVRAYEMPEPMVKTLENAEKLSEGYALYVKHKKVPQYLIPELEDRNFKFLIWEIEDGDVKLLIFR